MASPGLHGTLTCKMPFVHDFVSIAMQVCGLKWSPDDREIASGGNDNQLFIWNQHSDSPILRFGDHAAAVKAIAWSPHQHGLLASGGGTADRCIRFCNTATNSSLNCIDTGKAPCYYATLHDRFCTDGCRPFCNTATTSSLKCIDIGKTSGCFSILHGRILHGLLGCWPQEQGLF